MVLVFLEKLIGIKCSRSFCCYWTQSNEVLLGNQSRQYGINFQHFQDCLCLHHQGL